MPDALRIADVCLRLNQFCYFWNVSLFAEHVVQCCMPLVGILPAQHIAYCLSSDTTLAKKKTATTIMNKIRTLFLSWDIEKSSLIALRCSDAQSRGKPRHRANLVILRDKNSVLILCIIVVAVFFGQGSRSRAKNLTNCTLAAARVHNYPVSLSQTFCSGWGLVVLLCILFYQCAFFVV